MITFVFTRPVVRIYVVTPTRSVSRVFAPYLFPPRTFERENRQTIRILGVYSNKIATTSLNSGGGGGGGVSGVADEGQMLKPYFYIVI